MEFPLYKEWMGEKHRLGNIHTSGVLDFMEYAKKNKNPLDTKILCPCSVCKNRRLQTLEDVEYHLLRSGMQLEYTFWRHHGETKENPYVKIAEVDFDRDQVQTDRDPPQACHRLNDLIDDAYEDFSNLHSDMPFGNDETSSSFQPDSEYIRLKVEATRPLYPKCKEGHTTLYAMIGLHNIKSRFGLSGTSVSAILSWVKDLLPNENLLVDNYPHMKKCLKGLGMKYKSIHACPFDCILYRKEHLNKDKCPVCGTPRFQLMKSDEAAGGKTNGKKKLFTSVPCKVLKYFPIAPRLKRLYTVPWIAEAMTWHSRAKSDSNVMRHPIDSAIWQSANINYPEFSKEVRNVRLGISTDGFNPQGALSTNQSIWPVILVPYNLPPSLCMKKEFSILSLLIPGPKAPSDDIDVFMAPLVEDLLDLWVNGVSSFDSFKREEFNLKAMLLWAIHDFPAYGTLSGCCTHGYLACPICAEETKSDWLENCRKVCYHGHRRFLPPDHKFRLDKNNFLPIGQEMTPPPKRLSGVQVESKASNVTIYFRGKHQKNLKLKSKKKAQDEKSAWSRRSILFDLPYWKMNPVRHMIDVMHAEKNIVEHLVNTCLDGAGSKDGFKARKDLEKKKVKRELWIDKDGQMPSAPFTLNNDDRKVFLDTLYELKLPSNLCSNLRRVVSYQTHDLRRCKSHDWHVIMQLLPLLFKHCFSQHKDLRRAIFQISLCFTLLCAKVVNRKHIQAAKFTLVEATCILEKYFPHSFFDISIHLLVHLCDEAMLCGPVMYRWMYPFERLMKTYKDYVKQPRYIVGSIAEEYIIEEATIYAREYMPNSRSLNEYFIDNVGEDDEEALGNPKKFKLTSIQYEQVARYVFDTHPDVENWKTKYDSLPQHKKRKRDAITYSHFRDWVSTQLTNLGDCTSRLARLASGPSFYANKYMKYRLNGFLFSSVDREQSNVARQNSGVSYKALTDFRASTRDKNLIRDVLTTYYGVVKDILILNYTDFDVPVFYCDWVRVEDKNACKIDPSSNLIMVDLTKLKSANNLKDEPFVCTFQNLKQVYYSKDIKNDPWSIVSFSTQRLTKSIDALEPPTNYQSPLEDNPALKNFLVHLDD